MNLFSINKLHTATELGEHQQVLRGRLSGSSCQGAALRALTTDNCPLRFRAGKVADLFSHGQRRSKFCLPPDSRTIPVCYRPASPYGFIRSGIGLLEKALARASISSDVKVFFMGREEPDMPKRVFERAATVAVKSIF